VEEPSVLAILSAIKPASQGEGDTELRKEINLEEIKTALNMGGKHRAPGPDGIVWEFYVLYWGIISPELCEVLNQMYLQGMVTPMQTHGEMVCIPKHAEARQIEDFRPITLLNTDYKLLARIMANRLRPIITEQLRTTQYCGIPGNTILDAVSTIWDVIAYAESNETPLYVLSLVFAQAFDRISHQYLFSTLQAYGIGSWLIERVKALYSTAMTSIRIQGMRVGRIPVRSAIR
jgi:hypothetical protein